MTETFFSGSRYFSKYINSDIHINILRTDRMGISWSRRFFSLDIGKEAITDVRSILKPSIDSTVIYLMIAYRIDEQNGETGAG